ncbi:uncharacterized protein LOC124806391 isoform X2 [Hydra vulgaris]|uniref:Uncharacterized protein LOC124806391 isoform X2 n=1 Tax=Hydra vulgaris TaxID=6087 RepID=A0ABM4C5Z9_HYDVU
MHRLHFKLCLLFINLGFLTLSSVNQNLSTSRNKNSNLPEHCRNKKYAENTCWRYNTDVEIFLVASLNYRFSKSPLVCSTTDPELFEDADKKSSDKEPCYIPSLFIKHPLKKFFEVRKKTLNKKLVSICKKRQTLSWRNPIGMPPGTIIAFCNTIDCCTPKKTLNQAKTTYNLCRECVHTVTLPGSYSPRVHSHVTCQDTNYYETCLSGEGTCTTNLGIDTVTFLNKSVKFAFGKSCSCEIRTDSIFADFV